MRASFQKSTGLHFLTLFLLLVSSLSLIPLARGHDVDVTGVARVFLDELDDNS